MASGPWREMPLQEFAPATTRIPNEICRCRSLLLRPHGYPMKFAVAGVCSCDHPDSYRNSNLESNPKFSWLQEQTPATANGRFLINPGVAQHTGESPTGLGAK